MLRKFTSWGAGRGSTFTLNWRPPVQSAQVVSKDATLTESVHDSRGNRVVCM